MRAKDELVRFARERGGAVVLDRDGRMQGRGAYVCAAGEARPDPGCLSLAVRRGGISRTLRCAAKIDCADLVESVSP